MYSVTFKRKVLKAFFFVLHCVQRSKFCRVKHLDGRMNQVEKNILHHDIKYVRFLISNIVTKSTLMQNLVIARRNAKRLFLEHNHKFLQKLTSVNLELVQLS